MEKEKQCNHLYELARVIDEEVFIDGIKQIRRVGYAVCVKCGKIKRNEV